MVPLPFGRWCSHREAREIFEYEAKEIIFSIIGSIDVCVLCVGGWALRRVHRRFVDGVASGGGSWVSSNRWNDSSVSASRIVHVWTSLAWTLHRHGMVCYLTTRCISRYYAYVYIVSFLIVSLSFPRKISRFLSLFQFSINTITTRLVRPPTNVLGFKLFIIVVDIGRNKKLDEKIPRMFGNLVDFDRGCSICMSPAVSRSLPPFSYSL